MASKRTVDGLRRIAERLEARGIPVVRLAGWETRGRGSYVPRGHMNHHTGSDGSWSSMAKILLNGHGSISGNALCTWGVPADGHAAYLFAAGVAWHAGRGYYQGSSGGVLTGNGSASGTEAQGSGKHWTPRSLDVQAAINEEHCREFGHGPDMLPDHKDFAGDRGKWDRGGIDSYRWRERIRRGLTSTPEPEPEPTPEPEPEALTMPLVIFKMSGTDGFFVLNNLTGQIYPITSTEALDREERRLRQPGPHPELSATEARHYWSGQPLDPPQQNKPPAWSS